MSANESHPDAVEADYVYVGRRFNSKGKAVVCVRVIEQGDKLGVESLYDLASFKNRVIGGVYSGAKFYEGGSLGLAQAAYVRRWADPMAQADWLSRDEAVAVELRKAKQMANDKKTHEIEDALLPLRKLYAHYDQRADFAGKEALEAAVLRALRRRPRADQ